MKNNSGKALTIFLVLISVIFVSLTAISVFLLVKQAQLREAAEDEIIHLQTTERTLRVELNEVKGQNELLDLKAKEAEERIESLLEELDLANSVRDQVRLENRDLKESLESMKRASDTLRTQLSQKEQEAEQRVIDLQNQLDVAIDRNKQIEERRQELEEKNQSLQERLEAYQAKQDSSPSGTLSAVDVDLDTIVVSPGDVKTGQVVSVDHEAEFVIVNLGERHGVAVDDVLPIYKDEQHIGDVRISRVLPAMSAADLIPPLVSQSISEGDSVKLK